VRGSRSRPARSCARPDYQRSDTDPAEHGLHNPGCFVVWRTDAYAVDGDERVLIGPPETVTWFRLGRAATRTEMLEAWKSTARTWMRRTSSG
jgi:hypothetical protein